MMREFCIALIYLYFEHNVGIGNQILSIASCIKLAQFLQQPLSINSTLADILPTLKKFKSNQEIPFCDCKINASHEMSENDMEKLICPLQLSYCSNILVKGGQYFIPHLSLNFQFRNSSQSFLFPRNLFDGFKIPFFTSFRYQGVHMRYFSGEYESYPDNLLLQILDRKVPVYVSSLSPITAQRLAKHNFTVYQPFSTKKQFYKDVAHDYQALIDIIMLSRAQVLYLSPGSTFSYVAGAISAPDVKVFYLSRGPLIPKPVIQDTLKQPCAHKQTPIMLSCPLMASGIMALNLAKCPDMITRGFIISNSNATG